MKKDFHLLIDSSGTHSFIGLARAGSLIRFLQDDQLRNHASSIHPMLQQLLDEENLQAAQLQAVSAIGGPGSYTGLRIGLALAKGLCFALDIPLILHNALDVVANQVALSLPKRAFWVIQSARKNEVFAGLYTASEVIIPAQHFTFSTLLEKKVSTNHQVAHGFIFGPMEKELESLYAEFKIEKIEHLDMHNWARLDYGKYLLAEFADLKTAEPFYLKGVHIFESKK